MSNAAKKSAKADRKSKKSVRGIAPDSPLAPAPDSPVEKVEEKSDELEKIEPSKPEMTDEEAANILLGDPSKPTAISKPRAVLPARPIRTVATKSAASSRFIGIGSLVHLGIPGGLRRNEFQDLLLVRNAEPDMHWSDDDLAVAMDAEHPEGGVRIADRPELVQVIRKFYNAGTHSKATPKPEEANLSLQYSRPVSKTGLKKAS